MSPNSFFYIIKFGGFVYEVPMVQSKYEASLKAWQSKGILILKDEGINTSGAGIDEIMTEENYLNWVKMRNPNRYVHRGIWRDKYGEFLEYAPWKKTLIENKKKALKPPEPILPADKKKLDEIKKQLRDKKIIK